MREAGSKRSRSSSRGQSSTSSSATNGQRKARRVHVENYPRKRISVACDLCRFRKTKCDAARPTCGFCSDLGVDCHYRDAGAPGASTPAPAPTRPPVVPRAKASATSLRETVSALEDKLAAFEARLEALEHVESAVSPSVSLANTCREQSRPDITIKLPGSYTTTWHRDWRESNVSTTGSSSDFVFRRTRAEAYTARPSLLTFQCPPYVEAESWDDSSEFYSSEVAAGKYFHDKMLSWDGRVPEMNRRSLRALLLSFVENFLGWVPVMSTAKATALVNEALMTGYRGGEAQDGCLALFILAIGAVASHQVDIKAAELPGIAFFIAGCKRLECLCFLGGNLATLHCRLLQGLYFKMVCRPLLAWNSITQAARNCMYYIGSTSWQHLGSDEREAWQRTFWACSITVDELEATMNMHPIGHRAYHDIVPLPRFEDEDTGFYFFLAQISLRKLLADALDVVGYKSGRVVYAPLVTSELKKQTQEWYDHLPAAVRFPIDNTPIADARISFLRMQFLAMFVVLEWASVLRVLESHNLPPESFDHEELRLACEEAQECTELTALYLEVAMEQLAGWKLGTYVSLWTCFHFLANLVISFKSPALSYISVTTRDTEARAAIEMLRPWDHLSFVSNGLDRMSGMIDRTAGRINRG